jgi:CubicO group peptidase (beta-lactamase class C family)
MTHWMLKEGKPQDVGMDASRIEGIRKLAAKWVDGGQTPSLVLLAARRGTIVLHDAWGVRRPEDKTPTLKRDSIFPLSSCTKPITAAAVMCLVEDGLIGLNRPIIDYIPEWDVPGVQWLEEAKVVDLLCHTGGLDDLMLGASVQQAAVGSPTVPPAGPGQHPRINERIRLAAGAPLAYRPGTALLYSNFGFNLLGDIIRRVSGQPFWQFVQSRIFEPIGMRDSSYLFPAELRERRVYRQPGMPGTQPVPGFHGGVDSSEYDALDLGAGGAASTALDMAVFMQMLLNGGIYNGKRVLSPASVTAMTSSQVDHSIPWKVVQIVPQTGKRVEVEFEGGGYGFGMYLFKDGDRFSANGSLVSDRAFGHQGFAGAYFWADPESELVGVYLGVVPRLVHDQPQSNADLFMNVVHAAVIG